jgi:hypothetical protein
VYVFELLLLKKQTFPSENQFLDTLGGLCITMIEGAQQICLEMRFLAKYNRQKVLFLRSSQFVPKTFVSSPFPQCSVPKEVK